MSYTYDHEYDSDVDNLLPSSYHGACLSLRASLITLSLDPPPNFHRFLRENLGHLPAGLQEIAQDTISMAAVLEELTLGTFKAKGACGPVFETGSTAAIGS